MSEDDDDAKIETLQPFIHGTIQRNTLNTTHTNHDHVKSYSANEEDSNDSHTETKEKATLLDVEPLTSAVITKQSQRTNHLKILSEPQLPKTISTDAVEKKAADQLSNENTQESVFVNQRKWASLWIIFTAIYWTLTVWIPILSALSFAFSPTLIVWCVGCIGLLSTSYTVYEGKYPTDGVGRWTSFVLTAVVIIDFCILLSQGMLHGFVLMDLVRGGCHLMHCVWTSLFFYGTLRKYNPEIARIVFFLEWFDLLLSCAVIVVLQVHDNVQLDGDLRCDGMAICVVYVMYMALQLIGWMFPMMLCSSWGSKRNALIVSTHVFIVDLLTDGALILVVLREESYRKHPLIEVDVIWKTLIVIRSFSYYLVCQLWLNKRRTN
eukprot:244622_1